MDIEAKKGTTPPAQPATVSPAASAADVATEPGATAESATTESAAPKSASGGAPKGNVNAMKHGLRSGQRFSLALGKLPKSMARVEIDAQHFRLALEAAVVDRHGEIDLPKAALIATAVSWQRHSALCVRWLRQHESKMSHAERLSYSREIATASANRDKAIAALKLDTNKTANTWDAYYSGPTATAVITSDSHPQGTQEATQRETACNSVLGGYNADTLNRGNPGVAAVANLVGTGDNASSGTGHGETTS